MVERRQRLLRRLNFHIMLPLYPVEIRSELQREENQRINNKVFIKAIKDLFALFRSWHDKLQMTVDNNDAPVESSFSLCIAECLYPDIDQPLGWADRQWHSMDVNESAYNSNESSILQLESIERIQEVPQISSFHRSSSCCDIEPRSIAMIASKLPNSEGFHWDLYDDVDFKRSPRIRQQMRFDFAEALPMIPQGSLKRVTLNYFNHPPSNHKRYPRSALLPSFPTTDHLSQALQRISRTETLTHLELGGPIVISPSLFWADDQAKQPSWPNLVSMKVHFSMATADGDWYFTSDGIANYESYNDYLGDDGDSWSHMEWDWKWNTLDDGIPNIQSVDLDHILGKRPVREFRGLAAPKKLNPLFKAAAQAAAQMPRLQCMTLGTEVRAFNRFIFAMIYLAPGIRPDCDDDDDEPMDLDKPRLEWLTGPSRYEPAKAILEIWRRAKEGIVIQTTADPESDSEFDWDADEYH